MAPPKLNKRVQFPRRGTAENDSYVGPDAQIVVDNQRKELRLHDGRTAGGWVIPNLRNLQRLFLTGDVEMAQLEFPEEAVGILTRTGNKIYQLRELQGVDGVTVTNPTGVAGNPTINLPDRIKARQTALLDANLAIDGGYHVVQKGADSNLPPAWLTTSDATVVVANNEAQANGVIKQIAFSNQTDDPTIYSRRRVAGAWTNWFKKEDPVFPALPANGSKTLLDYGVDETRKLWSAAEISHLVREAGLESIQYVDSSNTAQNRLYNSLFTLAGSGAVTSTQTQGPFNMATNDRFEVVASATAVKGTAGDSKTAQIAIERSDATWDVLGSAVVSILAGEETKNVSVLARFIRTAGGYQLADSDWNPTSTVTATLTGRIRVTIGTADQSGARAARWR